MDRWSWLVGDLGWGTDGVESNGADGSSQCFRTLSAQQYWTDAHIDSRIFAYAQNQVRKRGYNHDVGFRV